MERTFSALGHDISIMPQEARQMDVAGPLGAVAALPIGQKEIAKAAQTLKEYKDGKANLEARVVEDEQWYKLRHWEVIRRKQKQTEAPDPEPTSAWLFDAISSKHADAMDNYPEPNILPREMGDEEDAKVLSDILPVIMERSGFEGTYSDNWWEKLKHGTAPYGVFWNPEAENGLGDIDIRKIDLLNIFWEPGASHIQASRNLFIVDLRDKDLLEEEYPELKGKLDGNVVDVKQYIHDDTVSTEGKAVVVDWYYKRRAGGKTVLHYAKFVGETLLFSSENEERYRESGWYDHGKYPVVFDTLFPEKGTPCGFGYIAITKDPQLYVDKLGGNILKSSMMATTPRFLVTNNTGVNEKEFADWSKAFIHVEGNSLDDARVRQLSMNPLNHVYVDVLRDKVNEMKETASNRDFGNGGTAAGVTAASAIAALQEAGNKTSRDMIGAAYRSYTEVSYLCLELIRQFYDESRSFRIVGEKGMGQRFVPFSNAGLREKPMPPAYPGQELEPGFVPSTRQPIFDIRIRAQKRSPFSRMSQNELAKELYGMGFFNPERAQEVLGALEMMEFEGKEKVLEQVHQGQTLMNICKDMSAQMNQMAALLQATTGMDMGVGGAMPGGGMQPPGPAPSPRPGDIRGPQKTAGSSYAERLAKRSVPDMNKGGDIGLGKR